MGSEWRIVSNDKLDTLINGFDEYEAKFSELVNEIKTIIMTSSNKAWLDLVSLRMSKTTKIGMTLKRNLLSLLRLMFFSSYDTSNDERIMRMLRGKR